MSSLARLTGLLIDLGMNVEVIDDENCERVLVIGDEEVYEWHFSFNSAGDSLESYGLMVDDEEEGKAGEPKCECPPICCQECAEITISVR